MIHAVRRVAAERARSAAHLPLREPIRLGPVLRASHAAKSSTNPADQENRACHLAGGFPPQAYARPVYSQPMRSSRRPEGLFSQLAAGLAVLSRGGVPDVSGLSGDLIEQMGEPYMRRHFLLGQPNSGGGTSRFHEILCSDRLELHDHPWDFLSVIMSGRYIERTPDGEQEWGAGSVLARRAEDLHRLTLPDGPVWTLVVTGATRRRWGFDTPAGWVPWREHLGVPPSRSW